MTYICLDLVIGEYLAKETRMTLDSRSQLLFPNFKSSVLKSLMLRLENITQWRYAMMEVFGPGDMLAKKGCLIGCTLKKSELLDMVTKNSSSFPNKLNSMAKTSK